MRREYAYAGFKFQLGALIVLQCMPPYFTSSPIELATQDLCFKRTRLMTVLLEYIDILVREYYVSVEWLNNSYSAIQLAI